MSIVRPRIAALVGVLLSAIAAPAPAAKITTNITVSGPFGTLPAVAFDGSEAMSSLFRYDVDVVTDAAHPLDFASTLGNEIAVTIAHGQSTRSFSGMCARMSESVTADGMTYRLELVPRLALLAMNEDSRIFQDLSVPDILQRVLSARGIDFQLALAHTYQPRVYTVQYRESDFNFVSRLMEEEGIYYFFTHGSGGHRMVVADNPAANPPIQTAVNFLPDGPKRDAEGVFTWQKTQQLRPARVTLRDFNFQLPDQNLEATAPTAQGVRVGNVVHLLGLPATNGLESYDYPGEYAGRFDGVPGVQNIFAESIRVAGLRAGAIDATTIVIDGSGNVAQLAAGSSFTLAQHPNGNGQYLVTGVHHTITNTQEAKSDYQNTFTAMPVSLPFRPQRVTPKPHAGAQSAVVVGPAGEEIFTDKFGRVKVQFHWDRQGKKDENSSCWIRVGATHQQPTFTIVPKIGEEVVVDFLEGDPDQPIVIGSVYNPQHMPPLP